MKTTILISKKKFQEHEKIFLEKALQYDFDEPYYVIEAEFNIDNLYDYFNIFKNKINFGFTTNNMSISIEDLEVDKEDILKLFENALNELNYFIDKIKKIKVDKK